jgi:hypothetical protein
LNYLWKDLCKNRYGRGSCVVRITPVACQTFKKAILKKKEATSRLDKVLTIIEEAS